MRRYTISSTAWRITVVLGIVLQLTASGAIGQETEEITITTTTEFDYAVRGDKKFGDRCDDTLQCGFPGSMCDPNKKSCQCIPSMPVTNHIDKCGKEAAVNDSCFFNEQCEAVSIQTECKDNHCICRFSMTAELNKDGNIICIARNDTPSTEPYVDPAMIGILAGMALMFIIICVVLRLFSRARWRENRTIFNTPNPRLMNVSLLRDGKLLHGAERRGSRGSARGPSRQPSMASLRPHSPTSQAGSRRGSRGSSNASAASTRSNKSPTGPGVNNHHGMGVPSIPPVLESVTVEVQEAKA